MFVRTIDSLYVSLNHYPQHVLCFHIISYLCVMHLFSVWRSKIFFLEKTVLILILYHKFILMFINIQRFVIKNYIIKAPVVIGPCHILYSENYHQLFKHWLLKLSKISWLHIFKRFIFPSNILKNILKYILHYLSVTMSYSAWNNSWSLIISYVLKIVS